MAKVGAGVFLEFFFALRKEGVKVSPGQWIALLDALEQGIHGHSKVRFFDVARSLLVSKERELAGFMRAFVRSFGDGHFLEHEELHSALMQWLAEPKIPEIDPRLREQLASMDLDELRRQFEERLKEQKERHDGGSHWIGTGGISPFGHGGSHPSGLRIGGAGGGRQAMAVLDPRRYRAFDPTRTLDTRQMSSALRRLRKLGEVGLETELDVPESVKASARMGGELEIVWRAPRKNTRRLLLLLDVGGSMDPHADRVSRLFSAVHKDGGFRSLRAYYFHNCVYKDVYKDAGFTQPVPVQELLRELDKDWIVVIVGDACMHPAELSMASMNFWEDSIGPNGLEWLAMMAQRWRHCAWLNPESQRFWKHQTIDAIGQIFSMYHLSLDGLTDMVDDLGRSQGPQRGARQDELIAALATQGRARLGKARSSKRGAR